MKLRPAAVIVLILTPFVMSLILAIALQSNLLPNPILHFQSLIDLGTLLLIIGALLTSSLIGFRLFRQRTIARDRMMIEKSREDSLQQRRRLLQHLDHELKNPLMALQTVLAYLSQEAPVENTSKVLSDMDEQVERIGHLVSDLRKLAQIEEQPIEREPVDINDLLQEIVEAARDLPGSAGRQIQLTLLQSPWKLPSVPGDRGLLWLACFNLLDNALKFTPPASKIEVRAFEINPWLVVEVTDNGPGIPPEELPHIFEELYRGKNASGCPGSGLGLALVRAIVAQHMGDISVRSRFSQGTVFTMRLPLVV